MPISFLQREMWLGLHLISVIHQSPVVCFSLKEFLRGIKSAEVIFKIRSAFVFAFNAVVFLSLLLFFFLIEMFAFLRLPKAGHQVPLLLRKTPYLDIAF